MPSGLLPPRPAAGKVGFAQDLSLRQFQGGSETSWAPWAGAAEAAGAPAPFLGFREIPECPPADSHYVTQLQIIMYLKDIGDIVLLTTSSLHLCELS